MNKIDDILLQLEHCVANNKYLSSAVYNLSILNYYHAGVLTTINAFLNSDGGTIVAGIHDDRENNRYTFTGVTNSEAAIEELKAAKFTNSKDISKDVSDYISYDIKHFLNGEVLVIYVKSIPAGERYACLHKEAYVRVANANKLIQDIGEQPQAGLPDSDAPSFQKIYSAELITQFGPDYISLEPDFKQMLSFIYEQNNRTEKGFPTVGEITSKLWAVKSESAVHESYDQFILKTKKALTQLEKNNFIVREPKAGYKVNNKYIVVKSLFN